MVIVVWTNARNEKERRLQQCERKARILADVMRDSGARNVQVQRKQ